MPRKICHLELTKTTGEPIRKAGPPQVMEFPVFNARHHLDSVELASEIVDWTPALFSSPLAFIPQLLDVIVP